MNEELKIIISANINDLKKNVGEANKKITGFGKDTKNNMDKLNKTIATIGKTIVTAFSVRAIVNFSKECFAAYNQQIESETKLTEIMKSRIGASDAEIQSVKNLASAQQQLGVVGDEVTLSGAQQLATFAKTTDTVNALIPSMLNLAVQQNGVNVTSGNMVSIANLMGKALQGQVGALSRVGISFTEAQEKVLKYGTEQERAAVLAQVITDNVGNMNEALAQTPEGKIQKLKNTLGDLNEVVGSALAPIITDIASAASDFFAKHQPQIDNFKDNVIPQLTEKVKEVFDIVQKAFEFIKSHKTLMETIAIIIGSITAAILLYNTYQTIATAVTTAKAAADAAGAASLLAYAAAQAAALLPTIAIIAAIAALIAIIVLCVKNWDKIKEATKKAFDKMKEVVSTAVDAIVGFFKKIFNWIKENWQGLLLLIVNPFAGAFKLAYDNCEGFRNKVDGFVAKLKDFIKNGFTAIKNNIINPIKNAKDNAIQTFENLRTGITNKLNAARDKVKEIVNKIKGFFKFEWSLPKLKMPHFSVSGKFNLDPPSIPKFKVDWYAQGGVFDTPTLFPYGNGAIGGLGEAGAEAIVPLENNTKWLDRIAERLQGGNRPIYLQVDGKTFAETSVETINQLTRQRGSLPLVIV